MCIFYKIQVPNHVEQPPSLRAGGKAQGRDSVRFERGKRQQLDELEFLSGRVGWWGQVLAGPGKGKPTIGDGWEEGRSEGYGLVALPASLLPRVCLYVCLSVCRLSSVKIHHNHHL